MALDNLVDLTRAVEQVESGGRRYDKSGKLLESGKGAQGEMQVMPGTVRDPGFGVVPARDDSADEIARVGRDYLAKMVDRYGNTEHALVAYNWGPTKADKWVGAGANKAKLPKETRDYLSKVNRQMVGSREATVEQPTVAAVTAPSEPAKSGVGGGTGVSRIRTLADNSPNFKAALAAHMLSLSSVGDDGEEDDEERTAAQEALDSMQEEPAQALDLDLTYSSPFRALQPEVAPAPMRFAAGGFVPKAAYSPTEKRELEDFNNQWQGYQDQYGTWRKEQYDPYQAAYEKYQTEVYNPYQTAYKAYESDYAKYAKAMDAYNAALPTRPMSTTEAMSYRPPVRPDEPVAPTLASEFTMEAPTTNLRPPGLTQEAYAGMDQAALDKYAQEQSAAASARATQASADQRNRQSALNVAFNPEQFNLSLPDRIASRFMAEGGLALPVGEAFTIKTAQDLQAKPYYDLEEMAKQDDSIWSKLPSEVFGIPISQDAYKQAALTGLGYAVGLGPLMNKVNQATGLVKTGLNIYDIATGQYLPNNPEVYQINNANIAPRESGMPAPVISSMSQPPAPVVNLSTPYVPDSGSRFWQGTPVAPTPAPVVSSGGSSPAPGPFSTTSSDSGTSSGGDTYTGATETYGDVSYGTYFADGGEVEEYPGIMNVRDYATQASERMFPTEAGEDDRRDAARHMLAAALASKAVGPTAADLLGKAHERFSNAESFFNMFGVGEPRYDYDMDVQNNRIGISLADQATSREELEALVKQMAEQASIRRNPNLPWAMDQEQRDALIEDRKRRLETPQYKNVGGEMVADETFSKDFEGYKALDPRAVEEAIYRSRNLTKKTDPDSWPSPGNPRRSIPNEPRDYPTRAGQELLEFLKQADRMPTVVEPRRYPGGSYDAPGFTYRSNNPEDRGVVEVPTFTKDGYGTLVHELTHSADRAMEVEQLRLYRKVRAGEPLTLGEQRFYDGYSKLYDTKTKLPLNISEDDLTDRQKKYRTSAKELRAFGTGNMAQDQPEPGRYNLGDIGATLNPHVDPTMAQEAAIMRDLYLRRGEVRGRAEGSPPEGEYADPEAAFMAGAGDAPAPNAENAAAALAAIRGLGEYPYNFVGGGVDLATMAMRPFGYDVEKPVMGSDWIKEKATQLGIRPPEETDPTLRDIRMGTEIATSVLDPFAGARAVAQGVQKTGQAARMLEDMTIGNMQRAKIRGAAEQVPDDAAYAPLRERMEAQGNLAMAVKPVGGYFQTGAYAELPDAIPAYIAGAVGKSDVPAVQQFVDKQMTDYLGKTMGSPKDPLRIALDEGRTPFLKYDDPDLENTGLDAFDRNPNVDRVVRSTRRATGFPEEGYAQTEKGEKFEKYVDWMVSPENPQDLILGQLPPRLKKQAEDAAKQQGIEVSNDSVLSDLFGEDTNAVLGIGPSESIYSFFDEYKVLNLQATKSMLEKMLTDPTLPERYRLAPDDLSQMTMADASVAAKKADNYLVREAEKNLLAATDTLPTTIIYPDKARWLAPDDVIVNPDHRAVVRALGKKGGWCTKNENEVDMYGANNNRLNILLGPNKKPSVQVTTTSRDRTAEDWFNTLSDEQMEVGEATYDQYLRENNIPYMPMRRFEMEYGLEQVFYDNPSFKDFQSRQQDVAWEIQTASFEQGGSKSKFTDYQFNKVMDLVRTRGARFDPNDRTIWVKRALTEDGSPGAPLLKDIGGAISPSVNTEAYALFKDTILSAPELVKVLRNPQVMQTLPPNIQAQADDLINRFADAPPDAFMYSPYSPEQLIPIIDPKKYKRWKNSQDPFYQSAMEEYQLMREGWGRPPREFAKGGFVERNVYNHQKYL
jgi:hypothetical protein